MSNQTTLTRRVRRALGALTAATLAAGAATAIVPQSANASTYPGTNGKLVFVSTRDYPDLTSDIYTMNPDGSGTSRLTHDTADEFSPTWSADGTKIAYDRWIPSGPDTSETVWTMNADGSGATMVSADGGVPTWSPDGTKIAVGTPGAKVYVINADGSGRVDLTDKGRDPVWSPDGTKIAFDSDRDGGAAQIYVMNADGTGQTRLTTNDDWDWQPVWSPDGTKIAFTRTLWPEGYYTLVTMNADGTGQTTLVGGTTMDAESPAWSPDGHLIAFATHTDADGTASIWAITTDGHGIVRLSAPALRGYDDYYPDWQPITNVVPQITPASGTVTYSDPITPFTVTATDADNDPITVSATGLPSGLSFTDNGNGTGTVSGIATALPGTYTVTYSASDGVNAPVTADGTITVTMEDCTLAYTGDVVVAPLHNTTLKAHFDEADATKGDLSNHFIVFDVFDSLGNLYEEPATTNTSGDASISVSLPADVYTVAARYPGGNYYNACRTTPVTGDTVVTVEAATAKVTGGGWISVQTRTSFGFNLIPQANSWAGQFQLRAANSKGRFHGNTITGVTVLAPNKISWSGTGNYNGVDGYTFTITAIDNGSGKTADQVDIVIKAPSGSTVYTTSGKQSLKGGNLVITR